jgi:hypothetical protein
VVTSPAGTVKVTEFSPGFSREASNFWTYWYQTPLSVL